MIITRTRTRHALRRRQPLIPCACFTFEQMLRAYHLDLDGLTDSQVWSELLLVRQRLAKVFWGRTRPWRVVRNDAWGGFVDELQWLLEREHLLEARLARQ